MNFNGNSGMTAREMVVVMILLLVLAAVLLPALLRSKHAARRASCQNNLKQFGLVYKMYATESRDELYPAMSLRGFERDDGGLHMTFNFGPDLEAIYVEYLTDLGILICPESRSPSMNRFLPSFLRKPPDFRHLRPDEFMTEDGRSLVNEWRGPEDGGALTAEGTPCTDPRSCIHAVDNSYWYWGFVFDKLDEEHGTAPVDALSMAMAAHGVEPRTGEAPAQLVQAFEEILLERALPAFAAGDLAALNLAAHADVPVTLGNADTQTIHRLREGIERFFITDIGNPQASQIAQAQIVVMFDAIGVSALDQDNLMFNHKEGGCNVPFMDGHVEFVRYRDRPPVTSPVAEFAAAVLRH